MQEKDKYNTTHHISDLIDPTIISLDIEEDVMSGKLQQGWEEIMGEEVSRHTSLFQLKKKEITLLTTSSVWRFELFSNKEEIINKCNEFLGCEAVETMKIR